MAQRVEEGEVGGWEKGVGRGGAEGPRAGTAPPLRAASPWGGRIHLRHTSSPSQSGNTALDIAKQRKHTEVIKLLENSAVVLQVGRAARCT